MVNLTEKLSIPIVPFILLILLILLIMATSLIFIQSYFNWTEINLLTEKAQSSELDYKLTIHNKITNSYTFTIIK